MAETLGSDVPPVETPLHDPTADDPFTVALDADGLRRRSIGGSLSTAVAQVVKTAVQFGSQIVLARLLFPADFGLLAMVMPLVTFIQLFNNLGIGEAIVQRHTISHARVSSLFWVSVAASIGIGLLVAGVSPIAAWIYREPRVIPLMMILGSLVPLATISGMPGIIFSRQMRFGVISGNEVVASIAGVVVTILCAEAHLSFWSLVAGQFATVATECALGWIRCGWLPARPAWEPGVWADLKFGFNLTGFQLATFITSTGDNVIVGALNGKIALGFYDRSYRLVVQPIGQALSPVSRVAVPLLSRLQDDHPRYRAAYLTMLRYILCATIPAMLVCISRPGDLVMILLGPRWLNAAPAFGWIAVGGIGSGVYSSLIWLYVSQGKMNGLMRFSAVSSVFNVISFGVGALWGITGVAACAALVFDLVSVPLMAFGVTRSGPVRVMDLALCCARYAVVSLIAALLLRAGIVDGLASHLARAAAALALTYGTFMLAVFLSREDRTQLVRLFRAALDTVRRRADPPASASAAKPLA